MPTHALLGATGSTGGAVLQSLLDEPLQDLELRIFVRNKAKLLKTYPDLESTTALRCKIFEGNLDNTSALQRCLDGAEIIYDCIASNDSAPGVSVAQDAANAVLAALKALEKERGTSYRKPTLLINRSTSLNEEFGKTAGMEKYVVHFLLYYCYDDIAKACDKFRTSDLVDLICVDPPALHAGAKRSGHKLQLTGQVFRSLNYPDLGAAFVEIAQRREEFEGKGVIVGATGDVEEHWEVLIGYLLRGLRGRLLGF